MNILVTGASRGIGKVIAESLKSLGRVYGCARNEAALKTMNLAGYCVCDLANAEDLKKLGDFIIEKKIDVLVNNAGITRDGLSFAMSMENWQDVINVNLTAPFVINQIISYDMIHKKKGSIINMASISGVHGEAGQVNYSASKAGLIGMTKALAKEIGKRKVRVNAVAPGFIETEMTEAVPEELRKEWLKIIPMNRAGTVEEVANVCLFLASDLSTYVTGQVIGIDGGMGA